MCPPTEYTLLNANNGLTADPMFSIENNQKLFIFSSDGTKNNTYKIKV